MIIKILGTGCPNCVRLEANARKAVEELGIQAEIAKVTDMEQIIGYGIMSTPALVVDEQVMSYGSIPGTEEIKEMLSKNKPKGNCSCGGKCC